MEKLKMVELSQSELLQLYLRTMPEIYDYASSVKDVKSFVDKIIALTVSKADSDSKYVREAVKYISLMLNNEGLTIYELSKDSNIHIDTFYNLWLFLNGKTDSDMPTDMFVDMYFLFMQLYGEYIPEPQIMKKSEMDRWSSGLDEDVVLLRSENRSRITELLVDKIDKIKSPTSRYLFSASMSREEKVRQVDIWWDDYKFHLSMAIKSPTDLNKFLNNTLSKDTVELLNRAKSKGMPFFITPYYLSLLNVKEDGFDDSVIRSYVIYSKGLVDTYGSIRAWEKEDAIVVGKPNAAGWLLPNKNNIHRRYPEVAIMIPDSMGRACGGLCAVCQRMYDFQSKRLNFDFDTLKPKESWNKKLYYLMEYFEHDTQLRDILITGGDALMSQNATIKNLLNAVYDMAKAKKYANESRADGDKYAELQRVRLGSRLLAYLPMRIDTELVSILRDFKERGEKIGIKQFFIQTHFQSPLELTLQSQKAIKEILSTGWIITNQMVYTVAASRLGHAAKLREVLNKEGVLAYYTFSVKGFEENYELFAPNSRSMQECEQEKSLGVLTTSQKNELMAIMELKGDKVAFIDSFLKKYNLPFIATDKNVLNLPGIGKSMTFSVIGITANGERIMEFEHDHSRRHSPAVTDIGKIYIVGNKSIAAYLRQIQDMGEDIDRYNTIWSYRVGETEKRFSLFEYPEYDYKVTERFTNLTD